MKLEDALFNWLQIKIVAEARPQDQAAQETLDFFATILKEDHQIGEFHVERTDETMIHVRYEVEGKSKIRMYDRENVERLLTDIESEPKYNS